MLIRDGMVGLGLSKAGAVGNYEEVVVSVVFIKEWRLLFEKKRD